ncbi:MAG: hypothetical protein HY822_24035 [Acidobacteria bacterium]|nr:hypothetical protein [Acidobacteriota bacterium]
MSCTLCETRKPRRSCPGVRGEICAPCCGAEREVTVTCPFECEYLQEARLHERAPNLKEEDIPNLDIEVTEAFLHQNDPLISLSSRILLETAFAVPGAADRDVQEALESLVKTLRTLQSGLYYESRPNNPLAAAIHQGFQARMTQAREQMARQSGVHSIRDSSLLGVLAFLQRLALQYDNGRGRGRSFLQFLFSEFADHPDGGGGAPASGAGSPLILP